MTYKGGIRYLFLCWRETFTAQEFSEVTRLIFMIMKVPSCVENISGSWQYNSYNEKVCARFRSILILCLCGSNKCEDISSQQRNICSVSVCGQIVL